MAPRRMGLIKGLKLWFDLMIIVGALMALGVLIDGTITSVSRDSRLGRILSVPVAFHEMPPPAIPLPPGARSVPVPWGYAGLDGEGVLNFATPRSDLWLAQFGFSLLVLPLGLGAIFLVRRMLVSTLDGKPFSRSNVKDLNLMGWIIVTWGTAVPLLQGTHAKWALEQLQPEGLAVSVHPPPLALDWSTIMIGLLFLVLAAVWREAVTMSEEQSLTV